MAFHLQQMKPYLFLFCLVLIGNLCVRNLQCARILALFHLHVKSHFIMFEALLKGLAAKGHDVVVVSHFPQKERINNYTDISIEGSLAHIHNSFTIDFAINQGWVNLLYFIWNLNVKFCEQIYEHPKIQMLFKSEEKFDLVITESFGLDCFTGFVNKLNVPHITMTSSVPMPWASDDFGNPSHPAYMPIFFLPYTDKMNFQQRLLNTVVSIGLRLVSYYFAEIPMQQLAQKHFGPDLPPLHDIARNTSLIFTNTYFSLNAPRPMVPAMVEVGGLHIGVSKKLPNDLETYINEAKEGIIYFSLGSLVRSDTFPQEAIRSFLGAFSELPQRVIWKTDKITELPDNVLTSNWLPQFDILSHPNVRVFITHGGQMGTQEAVYNGVPMLGIPLYSDQHHNIENLVSKGVAVKLDYYSISKNSVLSALKEILHNPEYKENAMKMSQFFRDRPQSPLDTAIFWTEYVIRNGGAPYLRTAAVDLSWYEYLLIDVVAFLIIVSVASCLILYLFFKKVINIFTLEAIKKQSNKVVKMFKLE